MLTDNKSKTYGFTLIEIAITVVIIGILSTIGMTSYYSIQARTRDSQRSSKMSTVASALEAYYSKNGEYPTCAMMTQTADTVVANTLKDIKASVLAAPNTAEGTNSFICANPTDINTFGYVGSPAGYTLKYLSEKTSALVPVDSIHNSTPKTPSTPFVAIKQIGSNISATISNSVCLAIGSTLQYSVRSRINEGAWGSYSTWASTATFTQPASGGVKYEYQAQARCYVSDTVYSLASNSDETSYFSTDAVTTPAAPTVTTSTGSTTTWSWTTPTCAANTQIRFRYDYTVTPIGSDSGWTTPTSSPISFTTDTIGQTYTVYVQAQCYTPYSTGAWSTSGSASYLAASPPAVGTTSVTAITTTSATLGVNITSDGGASVTDRGTCWGASVTTITNCLSSGTTGTGIFTQSRIGLPSSTLIYYRGYATNSAGTTQSNAITFNTLNKSFTLVGTIGSVTQGAISASVVPSWGTSESRTAGNLLICWVAVNGVSTSVVTPSGWSIAMALNGTSTSVAIFYKIATGGDGVPIFGAISNGIIAARVAEYSGGSASSALDRTGFNITGKTSPKIASAVASDANTSGELIVTSSAIYYSAAATKTLTDTINNATKITVSNSGTSTRSHYDFSYGISTKNTTAISNSFSFTTTNVTGASTIIASFKP